MMIEFFLSMEHVPTVTHQEKQVTVINGKPIFYEPNELKAARNKLEAHLAQNAPEARLSGPIGLQVKWCFKTIKGHRNGEYRTSRPDTDNLQKLLKDCMTKVGFWKDDAQVCQEIVEKFWSDIPGIWIRVMQI